MLSECFIKYVYVYVAGIPCYYSSTNCGEVDGVAPFMVTSQEECCLHNPLMTESRSFEVPVTSGEAGLGLKLNCAQCIGKENYLSSIYHGMQSWKVHAIST